MSVVCLHIHTVNKDNEIESTLDKDTMQFNANRFNALKAANAGT